MLPNDILNIIKSYNEDGIMVDLNYKIYWFNGKRFRFWCTRQYDQYSFLRNGDLYLNEDLKLKVYKNKLFINACSADQLLREKLLTPDRDLVFHNDSIYRWNQFKNTFEYFKDGIWNLIAEYNGFATSFGVHQNYLYVFSRFQTLKYNMNINQWYDIGSTLYTPDNYVKRDSNGNFASNTIISTIFAFEWKITYFKKSFYLFADNRCCGVFDTQKDKWQKTNIQLN